MSCRPAHLSLMRTVPSSSLSPGLTSPPQSSTLASTCAFLTPWNEVLHVSKSLCLGSRRAGLIFRPNRVHWRGTMYGSLRGGSSGSSGGGLVCEARATNVRTRGACLQKTAQIRQRSTEQAQQRGKPLGVQATLYKVWWAGRPLHAPNVSHAPASPSLPSFLLRPPPPAPRPARRPPRSSSSPQSCRASGRLTARRLSCG